MLRGLFILEVGGKGEDLHKYLSCTRLAVRLLWLLGWPVGDVCLLGSRDQPEVDWWWGTPVGSEVVGNLCYDHNDFIHALEEL